jgi:radical SAM protein with 4Fe4S-binding SPASM domain
MANPLPPDPAAPPPPDVSVRALFDDESGRLHDERRRLLASPEPADWQGIAFPLEVSLELASACNLKCVMCPVPTTRRPAAFLDEPTFRRATGELAAEGGFVLLPQGFGESLLHPRWAELLGEAKARRIAPVILLTNGMLLDERNASRLVDLPLDAVVVSIDGTTPETYASVRIGGDLVRVERNVRRLLELRPAGARPRVVLRIIRMRETSAEIEAFFERWSPLLSAGDEIRINEFNDWAGKVEDRGVAPEITAPAGARPPCRMLWSNLSVHADGQVSACCHDSEDDLVVGRLAEGSSLRGIWNGEALARLRRIHVEGRLDELPICRACRNAS